MSRDLEARVVELEAEVRELKEIVYELSGPTWPAEHEFVECPFDDAAALGVGRVK